MKVTITGNQGFIGRNLENYLKIRGHEVVGIDRQNGTDIRDDVRLHGDYIVHLAGISDIQEAEIDPGETFNVNVGGTFNMLKLAERRGVKRFVNISSAAVYGNLPPPLTENKRQAYIGEAPGTYGRTKAATEDLCFSSPLSTASLRLFNVYGPGQKNGLIGRMNHMSQDDTLVMNHFGKSIRDFVHVSDVCRAIELVLQYDEIDDVYNVGTGIGHTVKDAVTLMKPYRHFEVEQTEFGPEETKNSVADISKIRKLGWFPTITLENGIKELTKF